MENRIYGASSYGAAYYAAQSSAAKAEGQRAPRAGRTRDNIEISPEARAALAAAGAADGAALPTVDFKSFTGVYTGLVRDYDRTVRDHYGAAHRENMTFDDPAHHVWEKYKDPGSQYFRSDLTELERAWAFDQEMDLVQRGGKNMNLTDPYAYPDGAPSFSSTVVRANQTVRNQMDEGIGRLFRRAGVPEDASLRLSVDAGAHHISVSGLDDEALTAQLEEALNQGDNGKNLYEHIRLCDPAPFGGGEQEQYVMGSSLSLDWRDGHLMDLDGAYGYGPGQRGWQAEARAKDDDLQTFQEAAGPDWTRLWGGYNPRQGPLDNWSFMHAQGVNYGKEWEDRTEAGIRATMPALVEQVRNDPRFLMPNQMAGLKQRMRDMEKGGSAQDAGGQSDAVRERMENDPMMRGSLGQLYRDYYEAHGHYPNTSASGKWIDPKLEQQVRTKAEMDAVYALWQEEEDAIRSYYAPEIEKNYQFPDPLAHIARKYCAAFAASNLLYFRPDLSLTARKMAAKQERAIMLGGRLDHSDERALASIGGRHTGEEIQAAARKAGDEAVAALYRE